MESLTRHADLVLVTGDGLRTINRMIVSIRLQARRNGIPLPADVAALDALVTAAIQTSRSLHGHDSDDDAQTWVTTTEYARRTGCSERSARRHAQQCGRKTGHRWTIPIREAA